MNDEHQSSERDYDYRDMKSRTQMIGATLVFLAFVLAFCLTAKASDYTRDGGTADFMCCADKACATIISQHADSVRARDACGKLTDADGVTRYTRSNAFRITKSATSPPPPTCPDKPADETLIRQCTAPLTGTWTQTLTYTSAPAPTCWVSTGFLPAEAPAGACVEPVPELTAPVLATPTATPNANNSAYWNVNLSWTASTGATAYEIERCTGLTCTNFAVIKTVTASPYSNTSIPSSVNYRYRVRGTTSSAKGPYSNIQTFSTPAAPVAGTGTATLQWEAPTQYSDGSALTVAGYRVKYGNSAAALTQQLQVANPALTSYVVEGLASGTWYFALSAYDAAGAESVNSNVASKVLP